MTEEQEQNKDKDWVKKEIFSWIKTIVVAFVIAFFVNHYLIVNATVPTGSMEPTIMPKDRIMANRWSYFRKSPQRGDVVVFPYPDQPDILYVKRVIGLPGETIIIQDGKVYINDSEFPLSESYLNEKPRGDFGPYEIPDGFYFMLGDNRNNSKDSRYWNHPFVEEKDIIGKVFLKYFPKFRWMGQKVQYTSY
ncbi:MAG: signal peptidase I [Epulopiscium sp.]|nr:signal peptidase I [Candidatus Epulonipiscium sp.]